MAWTWAWEFDDPVNPDDTAGLADYDDITDWLSFATPTRGWGRPATEDIPVAAQQGRCGSGEQCQIWDLGLQDVDPLLLDLALRQDHLIDARVLTHVWSLSSIPTSQADRDEALPIAGAGYDPGRGCVTTFVQSAVEILGDDIGNDNGLCESHETCQETPNLGGYQGHGPLIDRGHFDVGPVVDVTWVHHEENGY